MNQKCPSLWGLSGSVTMVMYSNFSPALLLCCCFYALICSKLWWPIWYVCIVQHPKTFAHNFNWCNRFCLMTHFLRCYHCTVWPNINFGNLFLCFIIRDALFTHAARRIPGKHFHFGLLTFRVCFLFSPLPVNFLSIISNSFPTTLYTLSLLFLPFSVLILG